MNGGELNFPVPENVKVLTVPCDGSFFPSWTLQEIMLWSCCPWFWFKDQQECVGSYFLYLSYPSAIRDTVLTGCTTPEWRQTEIRRGCGTAVISLNPGRTLPRATLVALLGATCSLGTFSKRDHGCPLRDLIPPHFWRLHPLFERCCHPDSLCWFEKCPHWVTYLNSCSPVDGAV